MHGRERVFDYQSEFPCSIMPTHRNQDLERENSRRQKGSEQLKPIGPALKIGPALGVVASTTPSNTGQQDRSTEILRDE